ncbi:MAG: hypothetical protein ACTHQQ_03015 [Solirubrobacteraceae bacterium]
MPRPDSPGLGVGLSIMAQMADEVRVANRHDRTGTVVSMRFSLDGPGTALAGMRVGSHSGAFYERVCRGAIDRRADRRFADVSKL